MNYLIFKESESRLEFSISCDFPEYIMVENRRLNPSSKEFGDYDILLDENRLIAGFAYYIDPSGDMAKRWTKKALQNVRFCSCQMQIYFGMPSVVTIWTLQCIGSVVYGNEKEGFAIALPVVEYSGLE